MLSWAFALSLMRRVGSWLGGLTFWQLAFGAALLFAGWEYLGKKAEQRHSAKVEQQLTKCTEGRKADRDAYAKAQADAAAKNQADILRNEQRQKEISDARVSDLNARLERLSRELRDNPAAKGSAGRTPIPETGPTPCRAYDPAWLCLSPADRLLAAQNEERHDQLITWIEQQSKVNPTN